MIFLRPLALLMLLLPLLWIWGKHHTEDQSPWKKFMDKELWDALKVKTVNTKATRRRNFCFLILWFLWTIALAGPAWYKMPMPARMSQPNTILMMDLNQNIPADTLKKMHMRMYDVLEVLKGHRVALVLFGDNEGYTAMPLTPDRALVQQLIPDLTPNVVPQASINPTMGIRQAEKLIRQTGESGQIFFLTPDTEQKLSADFPLYLIGPQTNLESFLENIKAKDSLSNLANTQVEVWIDMGIWLVLISLPLMLFCFRKNVLFIFFIFLVPTAEAGFFTRSDQDDYFDEKNAVEAYKRGDYEVAQNLFKGYYNKGNALAYQGKIEEAIQAYEKALEENPSDQDARFNKEYLEKQIPPQEENQQQSQQNNHEKQNQNSDSMDPSKDQDESQQNDSKNSESPENSEKQNSSSEKKLQKAQNSEKSKSEFQNMQPTQDQKEKELEEALMGQSSEEPFNQKEQQILNRLNLDPSRVLRYRLNLQHQRNLK